MLKIAPSLLAADFANLKSELARVRESGAQYLHLDVMDGCFVPNISFGVPVIASLRKSSSLFFDVHLMIVSPVRYVEDFASAGADLVNFHVESCTDKKEILDTIEKIRGCGKKTGMTIKPATPPQELIPYLPLLDMVLVMSVEPGFGGQKFMPESLGKIKFLYDYKLQSGLDYDIEVDGGINLSNIGEVKKNGANVIVAGSSLFGAADMRSEVEKYL